MQEMRVGKKTCGIEKRGFTLLRCLQRCPLPDVDILQEKRRLKRLKRRKFIRKIYCAITKRKQGPKGKKRQIPGGKKWTMSTLLCDAVAPLYLYLVYKLCD